MGLTCIFLWDAAKAATGGSKSDLYKAIPDRNVFKLTELPQVRPPSNPPPALPKITLTGITTILGRKLAVLRVQLLPLGGQPGKEESYMLAEGQRDGNIEVLQINENSGDVKLKNSGTDVTLNIDRDSPKVARGPTPETNPPGLPVASIPPPTGGTNPTNGLHRMFPSRAYQSPGGPAVAPTNAAMVAPPSLPIPVPSAQSQPAPLTPEEQAIMIEVERERNKNNPNYPPFAEHTIDAGQNAIGAAIINGQRLGQTRVFETVSFHGKLRTCTLCKLPAMFLLSTPGCLSERERDRSD